MNEAAVDLKVSMVAMNYNLWDQHALIEAISALMISEEYTAEERNILTTALIEYHYTVIDV